MKVTNTQNNEKVLETNNANDDVNRDSMNYETSTDFEEIVTTNVERTRESINSSTLEYETSTDFEEIVKSNVEGTRESINSATLENESSTDFEETTTHLECPQSQKTAASVKNTTAEKISKTNTQGHARSHSSAQEPTTRNVTVQNAACGYGTAQGHAQRYDTREEHAIGHCPTWEHATGYSAALGYAWGQGTPRVNTSARDIGREHAQEHVSALSHVMGHASAPGYGRGYFTAHNSAREHERENVRALYLSMRHGTRITLSQKQKKKLLASCSSCFMMFLLIFFILFLFKRMFGTTTNCDSNPCKNSGNCTALSDTTYSCTCESGYSGKQCQYFLYRTISLTASQYTNDDTKTFGPYYVGDGYRAAVIFTRLDTEYGYDYVKIYDGATGRLLAKRSGTSLRGEIVTSGQIVSIVWTTDARLTGTGFDLDIYRLG